MLLQQPMAVLALLLLMLAAYTAARRLIDSAPTAQPDGPFNAFTNVIQPTNDKAFRDFAVVATLTNPVTLESFVLIFGGESAARGPLGDTLVFNTTTMTLQTLDLVIAPPPRYAAAFAVIDGGRSLFLVGGTTGPFLSH